MSCRYVKKYDGEKKEKIPVMISRVVAQWENDRRFLTQAGKPRVLSCDEDDSEFSELVRLVSKDLHPGTVLFELERSGIVERSKRGVRLNKHIIYIYI